MSACWLCGGLGGVAVHDKWSAQRGRTLFTGHEYPSDDAHPTQPCPACEVDLLRDVLVFADGRSVSGGYRLSDLYAADSEKQGVLQRAGCHPRSGGSTPNPTSATGSNAPDLAPDAVALNDALNALPDQPVHDWTGVFEEES